MRETNSLFTITQQNTRLLHSLYGYPTMILYDNLTISYLRLLIPCCDKRGGKHPLFIRLHGSYSFIMCPSSTQLFTKYLTLEFSSCLSNHISVQIYNFQSIPYFTMKHGNHDSCILSNFLKSSHNYLFLLQYHA